MTNGKYKLMLDVLRDILIPKCIHQFCILIPRFHFHHYLFFNFKERSIMESIVLGILMALPLQWLPMCVPICRWLDCLFNSLFRLTAKEAPKLSRHVSMSCRYHMMTSSNGNIFRVTGPLCGEFTGPGEFPTQRPVTRSFDVFFDLRLNKRLSKQPWGWWFETPSWSLWRQCNDECKHTFTSSQNHSADKELTYWGLDKMDAISQTTFSRAICSMRIVVFWLNFHWNIFAGVQLTVIQHWLR